MSQFPLLRTARQDPKKDPGDLGEVFGGLGSHIRSLDFFLSVIERILSGKAIEYF